MFDEEDEVFEVKEKIEEDFSDIPEEIVIHHTGNKPLEISFINKAIRMKYKNDKTKLKEFNDKIEDFKKEKNIKDEGLTSLILIGEYLKIIRRFIKIEFVHINEKLGFTCRNCSFFMGDLKDDRKEDEGLFNCPNCSCENVIPSNVSKLIKEINVLQPEYITSFRKSISKFIGKEYVVQEEFYICIDDYLKNNQDKTYLLRENIHKAKKNEFGIVENTSRKALINILSFMKDKKKYSKDTNEILRVYWNWDIPDISENINAILDLDIELFKFWNTNKNKNEYKSRDAFLGNQFRLYIELKTIGIKIHKDFFDLQENLKSLNFHKNLWADFCKHKNIDNVFDII